jgi:DNA-binding protein YbaB
MNDPNAVQEISGKSGDDDFWVTTTVTLQLSKIKVKNVEFSQSLKDLAAQEPQEFWPVLEDLVTASFNHALMQLTPGDENDGDSLDQLLTKNGISSSLNLKK